MNRRGLGALVLAAVVTVAANAAAQGPAGGIRNLAVDSDAPIHIESDVLEIDEPKSTATFIGKVRATQDNMQLTTDELLINYEAAEGGTATELKTIDAVGNVVVRVDDQVASGDTAHYELATEEVTLTGRVVLSQGENVIRGESIVVDLRSGKARVISTSPEPGQRVRAVFTPNNTE